MTESDIINGCVKNNLEAQKALHEKYYSTVMGICLRYSKDEEEASEIAKEAFLRIYNGLKLKPAEQALSDFIQEETISQAIQYFNNHRGKSKVINTIRVDDSEINNITITEKEEDGSVSKEHILSALPSLSPLYRIILNLHLVDEYSFEKIAQMLELSEVTARANYEKALFTLKKIIVHKKRESHASTRK